MVYAPFLVLSTGLAILAVQRGFQGVSKSVQVLFYDIEAVMKLTLIIHK